MKQFLECLIYHDLKQVKNLGEKLGINSTNLPGSVVVAKQVTSVFPL